MAQNKIGIQSYRWFVFEWEKKGIFGTIHTDEDSGHERISWFENRKYSLFMCNVLTKEKVVSSF